MVTQIAVGVLIAAIALAIFFPAQRVAVKARVEQRNRELAEGAASSGKGESKKQSRFRKKLDRAGLDISIPMYLAAVALVVAAFGAVGLTIQGTAGAIVGGLAGLLLPEVYLRVRTSSRLGDFEQQLGEALPMVAEGVRGGMTFEQSVRNVANIMDEPLRGQFQQFALERSFGATMPVAMDNLASRVKSRDMDMLAAVVSVQSETGGSMADVLDSIAKTIQRRARLRKHVAAVTADGRLSAVVIGAIPVILLVVLNLVASDYAGVLLTTPAGWAMIAVSAAMIAIGLFFIRKLYNIKIY